MSTTLKWLMNRREVSATSAPQQPHPSDQERASQARSFVLQPFWGDLLWALNEQREIAAARIKNASQTWDEDARNLEHWRAVVEIVEFVQMYPQHAIEQGGRE